MEGVLGLSCRVSFIACMSPIISHDVTQPQPKTCSALVDALSHFTSINYDVISPLMIMIIRNARR